jgi:hypothetical protein
MAYLEPQWAINRAYILRIRCILGDIRLWVCDPSSRRVERLSTSSCLVSLPRLSPSLDPGLSPGHQHLSLMLDTTSASPTCVSDLLLSLQHMTSISPRAVSGGSLNIYRYQRRSLCLTHTNVEKAIAAQALGIREVGP